MEVTLQNLTKIFPSRNRKSKESVTAVSDFSLTIPDGKLIGLLGPSGCGKSTLLNLISGLEKPTSGRIFFGGDDVTELPSFQKAGKELTVSVPETTYYALYSYFIADDGFTEGAN